MEEDTGALPKKQDFSEWYNELLWRAEIMDVRYPVKGLYVWFPYGFAIRRFVYDRLRQLLDRDHKEALFPLLIPEQEFMKEAEHIKGFEDEVYWVTHGGTTPLDVKLALRPTSETAIYPMFALWVRSHADLPLKIYQVVNTFRYETKQTRPLIRLREITSFMESHTVHATWDEAEAQVESEIALSQEFYKSLCIPIVISNAPTGTNSRVQIIRSLSIRSCPTAGPSRSGQCTTSATTFRVLFRSSMRTRTGSSRSHTRPAMGSPSAALRPLSPSTGTTRALSCPRTLPRSRP